MKKKRLAIIIALLAVLSVAGYFVIDGIEQANAKRQSYIKTNFQIQNDAFFNLNKGDYMPYDATREGELQIHINVYTRKTGKTVTIDDVKMFLKDKENADGSPRTWEDDTGIIYDFVRWCGYNAMAINDYKDNLQDELTDYYYQHPDSEYKSLYDLNKDQINELDIKLDDPNYELNLENLK